MPPFWKTDTFRLLRLPFSVHLLPIYLFALSQTPQIDLWRALTVFVLLHLLVYPASNGYNSYQDRDETPIGGLEHPPLPTRQLYNVTLMMDAAAVLLGLVLGWTFALMLLLYILASRAYSYRGIRLKKYPVLGFLTVFVFQGAFTFLLSYQGISGVAWSNILSPAVLYAMLVSSCFIGGVYPLTQVYQHEADRANGDQTLSLLLGFRGTFLFSGALFGLATVGLWLLFRTKEQFGAFWLFLLFMLPVVSYFTVWLVNVRRDVQQASFRNTMRMNQIAACCMILYFLTLTLVYSPSFIF
ncbi:1,4-dihydroxy-2-naphthoate octaprenyltransferase [Catalinimonas alkaloidigena]|uniref:1,4-dihydroxy-2-naphthoate octaprenyltransferase n=1 Tax=Catalinimonas alkaloidigena TaxID=1075417 RepID=A0A1G9QMS3_9BACT|nr:1,4-dihydroxy-2-naphthoate octaprenyltransferase [Catalinimonas alkaloidigena]